MKTIISSFLLLGILAASSGGRMRAADQPPLRKGKVLILKNEYTIEGDIEHIDDRYCVRSKGGEIWVSSERVLALTASLPDAYVHLRGRINLDDPDERLRLARWCRNNGLRKQALAELHAAVELRPAHAETRRLLHYWQQEAATQVLQRAGSVSDGQRAGSVSDGQSVANASGSLGNPPIEVTTESLGLFTTRVQPILMNTCARCHATGRGGKFHLTQVFGNSIGSRRTLEGNLAAVLAEVNVTQPEASPLLIKAVSDHAHTGQAPLRDRQAAPYRTLENWVKLTAADNPHLFDKSVHSASVATRDRAMPPFDEPRAKGEKESQWGAEARRPIASGPPSVASPGKAPSGTGISPVGATVDRREAGPAGKGGTGVSPVDPYDPEPFNRKTHPEANK